MDQSGKVARRGRAMSLYVCSLPNKCINHNMFSSCLDISKCGQHSSKICINQGWTYQKHGLFATCDPKCIFAISHVPHLLKCHCYIMETIKHFDQEWATTDVGILLISALVGGMLMFQFEGHGQALLIYMEIV